MVLSFDLHLPVSSCVTHVLEMKENVGKDLRVQEAGLSTCTSPSLSLFAGSVVEFLVRST